MHPDDELFADALELAPDARSAYLDRACAGDSAQRARLDALLAGHAAAEDFLAQPPLERPPLLPEEQPGDVLGRYTLLKKIGEGGCGVVYLAEQTAPLRRKVALKVIKLGMDTRAVITRFEVERQALALMDHPDIARVFDAGATDTGRPFFVMEFVDGVPITRFCDEHQLSMAARLELFARVCAALQHAHQKGIIHRDLKPSNILVALHAGVAAPKIIDFGIAKATEGRLTEHTLLTGLDQFIGTPAYMSPEQAERRDLEIDTRSDVYSLGVLLYELLTGRPPYDPQALRQAGFDEIRRIIREVEPPRPSTRLQTLTDADRATVARQRGFAPVQLSSLLRGDLDWIVMRCLEKDRARRYATAHELADDVRRHLRREPVVARPPTTLYRTQRFVARHRLACAAAAAVAASLVLGTVISVRQAIRATRAEGVARAERDVAQAATRAEALARADAQRRQEQSEALLTFMLGDFRAGLSKIGQLSLLDAVGDKAMAHFAALDPRDLTDTVLTSQAKALTQIGETRLDEARYADASAAFTAAYDRAAALVTRHPQNADMLFERAQAEYWIGFAARRRGEFATTRRWFAHYRDSAAALLKLEGKTLRAQREATSGHHNLAVTELDQGNLTAAREGFFAERAAVEEMLAAHPDDLQLRHRLADIASWLGRVAEADGRFPDALSQYAEMTTRISELIALEPNVTRWRMRQAESQVFTGQLFAIVGRRREAAILFATAHAALAALREQDPKNRQWQSAALNYQLKRVSLLLADGDTASAAPLLDATRAELEALIAAEPAARVFTGHLITAWMLEARVRHAVNATDARSAAEQAISIGEMLLEEARADTWVRWNLGQAHLLAGRIALGRDADDDARRHWERVLTVLGPQAADSNEWRVLDPVAQAQVLLGQPDQARPLIERLNRFGYRPIDPFAADLLGLAP